MRKIAWTLGVAGVVVLLWYLFVRPFEFEVSFRAKTLPGDVIQTIRIWDRSLDSAVILSVDSVYGLTQQIVAGNRAYLYRWRFHMLDDSTTGVNVQISEAGNSVYNKIMVPFTEQPIEKDAGTIARKFHKVLMEHLAITDVKVVGESETDPVFCVCRNLQTKQIEKANGMMRDYGLLTSFISDSKLKSDGPPIVKVRAWSHARGELKFDFCFPVVKSDSLPKSDSVQYQELGKERVLRAVYHGNYITSDRAWYALMAFAESNGYEVNGLPIEYFYNNPNLGANEEKWKAEVYLPIK